MRKKLLLVCAFFFLAAGSRSSFSAEGESLSPNDPSNEQCPKPPTVVCTCSSTFGTFRLDRRVGMDLPTTVAEGITEQDCMEALHNYPCTNE